MRKSHPSPSPPFKGRWEMCALIRTLRFFFYFSLSALVATPSVCESEQFPGTCPTNAKSSLFYSLGVEGGLKVGMGMKKMNE